ncbi:hypothetical protein J5N97_013585 [Dioscorea zingiberensis]|uniref:Phospholipid-transporting ATPase n=1 Tax=Dioscorea zingiberensis TaxID=325984 RepID=A0A9D5CQV0_9LILI|nr:hypothetical protein J5N97_013585 [Dioscorea zingiberensis]
MEIARVTQSYMMTQDKNMYHEATNTKFQCKALNINEDLGQIKYVFSDKTGTLTENKMVFQCASVDGVDYSHAEELVAGQVAPHPTVVVDGQVWRPRTLVKTDPRLMRLLETGKGTKEWSHAYDFFIALAACNTIVPQVTETSEQTVKLIEYQGESPDEQALVYAAAAYGFVLIERTSGHIVIDVLGERQRFSLLGLHEFDSDRKRMSVIVGCGDKTIKLFVKGADNAMLNVIDKMVDLGKVRATETHLHKYSSLGLRTLVIGMRELNTIEFEEWQLAYDNAGTMLSERSESLRAVALKIECNLQILGASGIEDKLQQGVPEAIESLRQAGIKVWVLTGDKQETAISIGYSCKLLTDDMTQIIINSNSKESCKSSLEDAISTSKKLISTYLGTENTQRDKESQRIPLALIIDGPTLVFILETELEDELYKLGTTCDVVLCCRVAPLQKAGIVALMKKRTTDMTLSIGDGANDVSMIQMADVGIGISGQEGRQAVMASDFAMAQFRFLVPLLFVHGHWNYQRMGYMILYNYYRNAVFVFMLYWYMFFSDVSLYNPITEISGLLYSAVYTALPTIIVGIYDQDLSSKTLLKYPKLYGAGLRDEAYNFKLFSLFMMDSIWQSLVIVFAPFLAYGRLLDDSTLGDIWILAVVTLVNLHLAMDIFRWKWNMHAIIWGLTILTYLCVIAIDTSPAMPGYRAAMRTLGSKLFWLLLLLIIALAFLPRFLVKTCSEYFYPSDIRIARELEKFGNQNEERSEVPGSPSMSHHQQELH